MNLQELVSETRLSRPDPESKFQALRKFLRAQESESIVQLHDSVIEAAESIRSEWEDTEEPRRLFETQLSIVSTLSADARAGSPPPLPGGFALGHPLHYEEWFWGWCVHQVLFGNRDLDDGHFDNGFPQLQFVDYFEGLMGTNLLGSFRDVYEEGTEQPWPLKPRQAVAFLFYQEQQEPTWEDVQIYHAMLREFTDRINTSRDWHAWWLSGPLSSLEFGIVESHRMLQGPASTEINLDRTGLNVTAVMTPNRDTITDTKDKSDVQAVARNDLHTLLCEVHSKYPFELELPPLNLTGD